jgi:hypothetical protein
MAWTAPLTATDGVEFTSSQYNIYIRDNMLEMAVAKATAGTQYFSSTGTNKIAAYMAKTATVATSQGTTSEEYTNLSTTGPSVTVDHGKTALVFWQAQMSNSSANIHCSASFGASGTSHVSPSDSYRLVSDGIGANETSQYSAVRLVGKLTPGTSTFTMKYRRGSSGTATFANRTIAVFPL